MAKAGIPRGCGSKIFCNLCAQLYLSRNWIRSLPLRDITNLHCLLGSTYLHFALTSQGGMQFSWTLEPAHDLEVFFCCSKRCSEAREPPCSTSPQHWRAQRGTSGFLVSPSFRTTSYHNKMSRIGGMYKNKKFMKIVLSCTHLHSFKGPNFQNDRSTGGTSDPQLYACFLFLFPVSCTFIFFSFTAHSEWF